MLFFLDQHGCAKNQVDGELLIGILNAKGWTRTDIPDEATLIIINSCGFIESAKQESLEAVITARTAYPNARVLLAGCLSERYPEELSETLLEADAFFGNGDLSRFPELLEQMFPAEGTPTARPVLCPPICGVPSGERPELLSFPGSAYVKITEGCDNYCSFCAIPLIRGPLRSRTISDIADECESLVLRGVWEINLIGQDLGSFGLDGGISVPFGEKSPLAQLLARISTLSGDFRIRLLYIHPDNFPRDILPVMVADPRLLPYFDIPFQSGDTTVIHRMNRKGNPEDYLRLVEDIRGAFVESPYGKAVLRSTFLLGFPGETEKSFKKTVSFLTKLRCLWSGAFIWSREEGTASESFGRGASKKTAQKRLDALLEIQRTITPEELSFFVGQHLEVLVEELIPLSDEDRATAERTKMPPTQLALARAWFQAPDVDGSVVLQFDETTRDNRGKPLEPGSVVTAKILNVNGVDVEAVVL